MTGFRFFLFGKFSVCCDQHFLTCFSVHKVQELICYLLLHRDKNHNRGLLAETLWDDSDKPDTKKYLRKTLWQLQRALRSVPRLAGDNFLHVDQQWIQISCVADYWLDIEVFESAFKTVTETKGREFVFEDYLKVKNAVELYEGDLLEGWYQDWCVFERERFREMYLGMNEKLMSYCEVNNRVEQGIEFGRKILAVDQARERTHQRLMQLYYAAGYRSAAIRQFELCSKVLKEELGVEPTERTRVIFDRISNDTLPIETEFKASTMDYTHNSSNLKRKLGRLKSLLQIQTKIQEDLKKEIKEIEQFLQKG